MARGALFWQVYEDVAHPEGWVEVWSMESWTDHLREAIRLSDDDRKLLVRASIFQRATERPARYLAVDPYGDRRAPEPPLRRQGRPPLPHGAGAAKNA